MQRLSFGFYPTSSVWSIPKIPITSSIGEEASNPDRRSDNSYTVDLDQTSFDNVIARAVARASKGYDLNGYNCTDYALDVFNSGMTSNNQLTVPNTTNYLTPFTTPSGLYNKLTSMKATGIQNVSDVSSSPPISTNCD